MNVNLARKWRSRTFDEMVGQELSVRMLKNSLYLSQFFPVYLFSGQRGCGKTTAARIFSTAINCKELPAFQKDPKRAMPCLSCDSCVAMAQGKHPDFIEMDAASHTGVDNVRQIIDAASLLPVLGRKKIYLIDEAHMLSKAAFNAFLKILEEPPASVFFILATTDPQKIIDTVRSRCFQVLFRSIAPEKLVNHLEQVCAQEDIVYEQEGLQAIVAQTEGSARDAINLLEQVRFSTEKISKDAVLTVVGHLDDNRLLELFDCALNKDPETLLHMIDTIGLRRYAAPIVWGALVRLIRNALWLKYNQPVELTQDVQATLQHIINGISPHRLINFLHTLFAHELLFIRTSAQHEVIEMVLLKVCQQKHAPSNILSGSQKKSPSTIAHRVPTTQTAAKVVQQNTKQDDRWSSFLQQVNGLQDPLVISVFKQGQFVGFDETTHTVSISFSKNFSFFSEMIESTKASWEPILKQVFHEQVVFQADFSGDAPTQPIAASSTPVTIKKPTRTAQPQQQQPKYPARGNSYKARSQPQHVEKRIDVSDKEKWQKTNMVLQVFPGTVHEIVGDAHG